MKAAGYIALLLVIVAAQAHAATIEEAMAALERDEPHVAAPMLEELASSGNARAKFALAVLHDLGAGVRLDHARATRLLREAGSARVASAARFLGWKYRVQFGVEKDAPEAEGWKLRAKEVRKDEVILPAGWLSWAGDDAQPAFKRALEWMRVRADANDAVAMGNLADVMLRTEWTRPDLPTHLFWLRRAAEAGDGRSAEALGDLYESGEMVPRDETRAREYFVIAAEAGVARAQAMLGLTLAMAVIESRDYFSAAADEAIRWLRLANEQAVNGTAAPLAVLLRQRSQTYGDDDKIVKILQAAGRRGDAGALAELGWMLEHGRGIPKDLLAASERYREALDKGYGPAGYSLAVMLARGDFGRPDWSVVISLYERAAKLDCAPAMVELGMLLEDGVHTPKDPSQAFIWYQRAAQQNHTQAQVRAATMLREGIGTERDPAAAVALLQKAAARGDPDAQARLGLHLAKGLGIERDATAACSLLLDALRGGESMWPAEVLRELLHHAQPDERSALKQQLTSALSYRRREPLGPLDRAVIPELMDGPDFIREPAAGLLRLEHAADIGDWDAAEEITERFLLGARAPYNPDRALHYAEKVSPQLRPALIARIDLVAVDPRRRRAAHDMLLALAERQNPFALRQLGRCHATGIGLPLDLEAAWRAAEQLAAIGHARTKSILDKPDVDRRTALAQIFNVMLADEDPPAMELAERARLAHANRPIGAEPRALHTPPPIHPPDMQKYNVRGEATVSFVVTADGSTTDVECTSATHPMFAAAAESCVRRWWFVPARDESGAATTTRMRQSLRFDVETIEPPPASKPPASP